MFVPEDTYTLRQTRPIGRDDEGLMSFWQKVDMQLSAFSLDNIMSIETMLFKTPSTAASASFPS